MRRVIGDMGFGPVLTEWQRAQVLAAAQYLREVVVNRPEDEKGRAAYEGLLDVLEPGRRIARHRIDERHATSMRGSMWDRRSVRDRRVSDRRTVDAPQAAGRERRRVERRRGRDRRAARS